MRKTRITNIFLLCLILLINTPSIVIAQTNFKKQEQELNYFTLNKETLKEVRRKVDKEIKHLGLNAEQEEEFWKSLSAFFEKNLPFFAPKNGYIETWLPALLIAAAIEFIGMEIFTDQHTAYNDVITFQPTLEQCFEQEYNPPVPEEVLENIGNLIVEKTNNGVPYCNIIRGALCENLYPFYGALWKCLSDVDSCGWPASCAF